MSYLLILAAGASSRMRSSAHQLSDAQLAHQVSTQPKAMLPVAPGGRPFLDVLLFHAARAGYQEVLLLRHPEATAMESYYRQLVHEDRAFGLTLHFAVQQIPADRQKPAGTADAVAQALQSIPSWNGHPITICNGDNLYSVNAMLQLRTAPDANAMMAYNSLHLQFAPERLAAFSMLVADAHGYLQQIIEKPSLEEINRHYPDQKAGYPVGMNLMKLDYASVLRYASMEPYHPIRQEKELSSVLQKMALDPDCPIRLIPVAEHVPDLTSAADLPNVMQRLQQPEYS